MDLTNNCMHAPHPVHYSIHFKKNYNLITTIFDPLEGLKGYLCTGINILVENKLLAHLLAPQIESF